MTTPQAIRDSFVSGAIKVVAFQRTLALRAMEQLADEEEFHRVLDDDANSIAVIVRHLHGNLLSRFTDFPETDGEKAWRDRDAEFVDDGATREQIVERLNAGYDTFERAIGALTPEQLAGTCTIRGKEHTVCQAIMRAVDHCGCHVGQIVGIARRIRGADWQTLSIPRGGSRRFNERIGYDPGAGA